MNPKRIATIILHSWYHLNHSMETWVDIFWWPLIQLIVFGLIALYLAQSGNKEQADIIIMGLILWDVVNTGHYSVSVGMLWEVWTKSFTTMFVTPLTLEEYIVGQMISGLFKSIGVFLLTSIIGIVFYHFSIFRLGWWLPIYFIELLLFSWAAGMFVMGLIFRFGTDIQSLSWSLINVVQPISAVYFPMSVLPSSIRWIGYIFPLAYIFESAQSQLTRGVVNTQNILIASLLNVGYFLASYVFLKHMFYGAKKSGAFARMEG